MAEVICGRAERYRVNTESLGFQAEMTIDEAKTRLRRGERCSLYVDGWTDPWPCSLDRDGQLRAMCPTASTWVRPRVIEQNL